MFAALCGKVLEEQEVEDEVVKLGRETDIA